jgi:hypothetical protein
MALSTMAEKMPCGCILSLMRRVLKIIWSIFIGLLTAIILFIILLGIIYPLARGWHFHHQLLTALDNPKSVRVVEHSDRSDIRGFNPDYKEVTYATVTLTPVQVQDLRKALPIRLDYSGLGELMCIFEEHHYIEITESDGTVTTVHICFHCGQLIVNKEVDRIMPIGWHSTLSNFISSIGLHPDGPWDKNQEKK